MTPCGVCGSSLPDSVQVCPDCGTEMNSLQGTGCPAAAPPVPAASGVEAVPAGAGVATLILKRNGALTGDTFVLAGRVVVGRFDKDGGPVDVDLAALQEKDGISRRHCEISNDVDGRWTVKDLGSHNGTWRRATGQQTFEKVGGGQPLGDGDELALGNVLFVFRVEAGHV